MMGINTPVRPMGMASVAKKITAMGIRPSTIMVLRAAP